MIDDFLNARITELEKGPGTSRALPLDGMPEGITVVGGRVWLDSPWEKREITDEYLEWLKTLPLSPSAERALREAAAYRKVIECAREDHKQIEDEWGSCQSRATMAAKNDNPPALEALATIWSDHPDFDPAWLR